MDKKYIFQCGFCKKWWLPKNEVRVWEKEVLYHKPEGNQSEKEGEFILCKVCYNKLK